MSARGALVAIALLSTVRAAAAPSPCPTPEARADYLDGRSALNAGDAQTAADRLAAARALCPAPAVDFYLAAAYEKLGRLRLAIDSLQKYLAAPSGIDNREAVAAWRDELEARAAAEEQGVPPPILERRPPVAAPPPYFPDEVVPAAPKRGSNLPGERWLLVAGLGAAYNGSLQPGSLSGAPGTAGSFGASYQLAVGYRVAQAARFDLEVLIAGHLLPWTRSDPPFQRGAMFATMIGLGLRLDLPLWRGAHHALLLTPSVAGGLGSMSLNTDPTYENALAFRFGLALALTFASYDLFVEPESFLLVAGDLRTTGWTVGGTAGVRVHF